MSPLKDHCAMAIKVHAKLLDLYAQVSAHRRREPQLGNTRLLCCADIEAHQKVHDTWRKEDSRLQNHLRSLQGTEQNLITALIQAGLPQERWLTVGDKVIGIAYSNWGYPPLHLRVANAGNDLPSLNERHVGD